MKRNAIYLTVFAILLALSYVTAPYTQARHGDTIVVVSIPLNVVHMTATGTTSSVTSTAITAIPDTFVQSFFYSGVTDDGSAPDYTISVQTSLDQGNVPSPDPTKFTHWAYPTSSLVDTVTDTAWHHKGLTIPVSTGIRVIATNLKGTTGTTVTVYYGGQ